MAGQAAWPQALWLVRHGESAGNVASDLAEAGGLDRIDIAQRDMDVPLSARGEDQARALGRWIAGLGHDAVPTAVITSPYARASATARLLAEAVGEGLEGCPVVVDERLREREFGALDRLTKAGIRAHHPDQAAARAFLGKFYHRPPGGESWCDVVLRLRTFVDSASREYCGERVLVVTHQVVVLLFRYILEQMTETEVLAVDMAHEVANCSLTSYELEPGAGPLGRLALRRFNFVAPLLEAGQDVTREPDGVPAAD